MNGMTAAHQSAGLGEDEIARFRDDGFLVVDNVFSSEEVEALREVIESPQFVEAVQKAGGDERTVHMLELTTRHAAFLDLARDPRIASRLVPLLGPDIQLQHSKLATQSKTSGKGGFGWHQDFAYFPHTNTDLAAVMVMLDDATPENGCMRMVRGSHRLGLRDHNQDGFFAGACQESWIWEDDPEAVFDITPRAGGISIHHCLTLHGSGPNLSGRPRRGLVFQYRADDAYQLADGVWADTGLMVCGQRRDHVRCEVQTVRLPRNRNRYGANEFGGAWNQEGESARQWNEERGIL
jgi:phytanoyl-CoA hydroxylase